MASYKIPENCLYTRGDTWVRRENDGMIRMGIASIADAEKFIELGATRLGTSRIVKIIKNEEASGY